MCICIVSEIIQHFIPWSMCSSALSLDELITRVSTLTICLFDAIAISKGLLQVSIRSAQSCSTLIGCTVVYDALN